MISPEREIFNNIILPLFLDLYVKDNDILIDIGAPNNGWGYHYMCNKAKYLTIDRNDELVPDILLNMEHVNIVIDNYYNLANCIIAMGIWEQCDNPFKLIDGIKQMLIPEGFVLFGILLTGYPLIQDIDYIRFTEQGAKKLVSDFNIRFVKVCYREDIPSQIFIIGQNKKENKIR